MSDLVGQTVSHYKILEKLGEGGMGVVYKAEDLKLTRTVALKFLPHGLDAHEPDRARFLQEARAAAILNHPSICTVYDIQEHDGQQFIVMEYVEGKTLREIVSAKKMQDAITYAVQIAEALHEAHTHGIVHRDIKAENIMVNSKNQVKVMDFGLAKLKGSLKLTKTSRTVGTLAYMAPEQLAGAEADHRCDLFSFGVVMFEMFSGRSPFRGEHEAALVYSIMNEEVPPLALPPDESSTVLEYIIHKALEKDPNDRYQSAHEILVDLRRTGKQAGKIALAGRTEAKQLAGPAMRKVRRRKTLIIGTGTVLIGLAAVAFILFSSAGRKPFGRIDMRRLTTSGMAGDVRISADGKVVTHSEFRDGKQSYWVRQVATGSAVQVSPPFKGSTLGTTITPDGEFLLYGLRDQEEHPLGAVFKVPLLGGQPRELISWVMSSVGVSSDGSRLAFIRQFPNTGDEALMVCASDGSGERTIATRTPGNGFFLRGDGGPDWSPDDRLIAVSAGIDSPQLVMGLLLVSAQDGSESWLGPTTWERIHRVAWLPNGSGVLLVGALKGNRRNQLWIVDYPEGSARRVTSDLNAYMTHSLGLTRDGSTIAAGMYQYQSSLWQVVAGGKGRGRQLTLEGSEQHGFYGLAVLTDGRIAFSSVASGNEDLWIVNAAGKSRIQVTTDPGPDTDPAASPDGSVIAFSSLRSGSRCLWRMNINGSGLRQLTYGDDAAPTISADGKWVYFHRWSGSSPNIWRVSLEGGTPGLVIASPSFCPDVSPDSRWLVCIQPADQGMPERFAIFPVEGGEPRAAFDRGDIWLSGDRVRWSTDGKSLIYIDQEGGVYDLYAKPIDGGPIKQLTHFESGVIFDFAVSPDGRSVVCARGSRTSDVVLITDVR